MQRRYNLPAACNYYLFVKLPFMGLVLTYQAVGILFIIMAGSESMD